MADLMVRTGIDARGFKRGLYAMEKDLGDAGRRMSGRFGGERGFDPFRLDKGLGKAGAMAIGFNPRTGLVGGLIIGLKDAYSALEKYEQKLPEVYRRTSDISSATGKITDSWARGAGPVLDMFGGALDWIGSKYDRLTSRLGAFGAMVFGGGTAGPGQIDDFLKETEAKMIREGGRADRATMRDRSEADLAKLSGDTLTADLREVDIWRREALAKLEADRERLKMTAEEYGSQKESIDAIDMMKRSEANARWDKDQKERVKAQEDAREKEREAREKERKERQKEIDDKRMLREDATVDIYEAQARFRAAKATTDQEKKSAEEARVYAKYKREELAIQRMGLDMDQETVLSLFNQAEYESTIEGIRSRRDDKKSRTSAPDGLDLSTAGAVASQGQAFAFSIPGKIDRTNALLQQANQTLREIKQGQGEGARFAP